jgi:thiamine biosynthesis lipoprotein
VSDLLLAAGCPTHVVDGSGDLRVRGGRTVCVGLEDPDAPGRIVGSVEVREGAICASATTRRAWGEGWHHILVGLTGRPARGVSASWVLAPTCAKADGLSTALFLAEPDALAEGFDFDFALLRSDRSALISQTFPGELYLA